MPKCCETFADPTHQFRLTLTEEGETTEDAGRVVFDSFDGQLPR